MAGKIQLMSASFCGWMESAESNLSKVRDELDLLEDQERRLSGIWESGAEQQWEAGFQKELLELRQSVANMADLLPKITEAAEALFQVEKELIGEAEKL